MLKVAICDDQKNDIQQMCEMIKVFSVEHPEHPVQVEVFQSSFTLLDRVSKEGGFDLYLLDILMPNLDGMELARKIRTYDTAAEIMFLTTSREYAIDAFSVRASNYLVKPIMKSDFDREMLACIKNLTPQIDSFLVLKTKEGLRKLCVKELVMVESFNHRQVCTLADGTTLETTTTLRTLFEELQAYGCFYMPHRSYIVHLDYVQGFVASELLLTCGKSIPVSRRVSSDLKETLLKYMTREIPPSH